jgi:RsiW-degrading membrane proteinase PrsW (M82 family)
MMENRGRDWRTILLSIASLCGALSAFSFAALIILYTAMGLLRQNDPQNNQTTLQAVVISSAIFLIGLVFLPSGYYSIQRLRGKEILDTAPKLLKIRQGILLLLIWASAAALAQLLINSDILMWFTPPLYLLAIGTPVYFLVRLASGGLKAGSRQRIWGVVSTSIALGTSLSIITEIMLVIVGLVVVAGYIGLHPELLAAIKHITDQITNASSIDTILTAIEPWLNNPLVFLLALLFFSGFTPVIEETAKSLAVWTVFDHLDSPAQGFVIGAFSGAGFGLFESLLASATPDSSWGATLMIRGGSTMMHIMTASLTGWGIAFLHAGPTGARRIVRTLAMYAVAISMHGLWNASVVMIAFGGLRVPSNIGRPDLPGMVLIFSGVSVLVILCLAIPLALGIINKRLRMAIPIVTTPLLEELPNLPLPDENGRKDGGTIIS